jgi:hypothetical protein
MRCLRIDSRPAEKAPVACNRRAKYPCSIGISRGIIDNHSSQYQLELGTKVFQYDCEKKKKRDGAGKLKKRGGSKW